MKYIVLVPDGMADEPLQELGGKTPLEAANTPNMDRMAQNGFSGLVQTIPDGLPPGSDIGNLALLGYDPKANYTGRAPLEAASMKINLADDELAFRCNMVTIKNDVMVDYSAGHIATEDADKLIIALNKSLSALGVKFYTGKSYRHIMVVKTQDKEKLLKIKCTPPHDIIDKDVKSFLPQGADAKLLLELMKQSKTIIKDSAATQIWLWGQGGRPKLESFQSRYGMKGSIISAVDLVTGIGYLIGLDVINVPGANGYYDTNYKGKAEYGLNSLKDKDFIYIHVEAPDEAGHNGDWKAKVQCIERFDSEVVGTILNHLHPRGGGGFRVLISPDHPTPVAKRTHTRAPVCFVMYGQGIVANNLPTYSESAAQKAGLKFESGEDLIAAFFKK